MPPRQIPFNAGYIYFELTQGGSLWEEVVQHEAGALHVAGDFPSLKLEVRGARA